MKSQNYFSQTPLQRRCGPVTWLGQSAAYIKASAVENYGGLGRWEVFLLARALVTLPSAFGGRFVELLTSVPSLISEGPRETGQWCVR